MDRKFTPVNVGDPYGDGTGVLLDARRNALLGTAVGGTAAGLYLLAGALKNRKTKTRQSRFKRILKALGVGAVAGAGAFLGKSAWDLIRGTNYSHSYKDPEQLKKELPAGASPALVVAFSGANSGNWLGDRNDINKRSLDDRYGEGNFLLVNPFDSGYAKDYVQRFKKAFPNARIRIQGHSYGGPAAYRLANWAAKNNIPVDKLITLDPIFRFGRMQDKPGTTAAWDNYMPSKANWRAIFDLWAMLGGRHPKGFRGANNVVVDDPRYANHTDIKDVPYAGETKRRQTYMRNSGNAADDPDNWWTRRDFWKWYVGI